MDTMIRTVSETAYDKNIRGKQFRFICMLYAKSVKEGSDEFLFTPSDYTDVLNTGAVTIRKYLQKAVELGLVSVRKVNHDKYGRVMIKLLG